MRDVVILGMFIGCCLMAIRKPYWGILSYVGLGLLNPHSFAWGFARTIPMAQLVVVSTFLGMVLFRQQIVFPKEREVKILIALFLMFCVSTVFAINPENATTKLLEVSKIFLMVFIVIFLINTKERLWGLLRVIALCLGFFGLKGGIWSILSGGQELVFGPEESFLYSNNSIGLALGMNLPILFYLFRVESRSWLKYIFLIMFIFSYPAIICTFSRGAWMGACVATFLILWYTRYRFFWLILGGMSAAILAFSMITFNLVPEKIGKRFDQLVNYEEESSAQSRLWSWEFCRRVGFGNPLTGAGFNYYSREMYQRYYPEFLTKYTGSKTYWSCHSMWFTILGEQGFIGSGLWVSLLGSCFLGLRKAGRNALHLRDPVLHLFSRMFVGVFLVYMVVGTFLDVAYFELFFQMVAAIVCLKGIVKSAQKTHSKEMALNTNNPTVIVEPKLA